jgi:site-specific DNA-methyltransferase (adenine-specific)
MMATGAEHDAHQDVRCADAEVELPKLAPSTVKLVYLDPPFNTGSTKRAKTRKGREESTFTDRWTSMDDYVVWLERILAASIRTLTEDGSIFVHCDWHASHHVRVLLDRLLGVDNFRNEIIWHYRRWTNASAGLQKLHQTIYYYSRSPAHRPNIPMVAYSPTTNLDQIWQARTRDADNVSIYASASGRTRNAGAKKGVPLGDVWEIPPLNPKAKERVGYPTQKPVVLLERILEIASEPGDLILDPCCGSGTTLVAAKRLGRSAIGIDSSDRAVEMTASRLENPVRSRSRILGGRDEFEHQSREFPERAKALDMLNAHAVQRNRRIHGYLSPSGLTALGLPDHWSVPVTFLAEPVNPQTLDDLEAIAADKEADALLLLAREDRMEEHEGRVIGSTWPVEPEDLVTVRASVQRWLKREVRAR